MIRLLVMVSFVLLPQLTLLHRSAIATDAFFDDFSNGDAQDNDPVTWIPGGPASGTTFGVVDKNLVLGVDATGGTNTLSTATADGISLLDVSIRTQLRLSGNGRAAVFGRGLAATITSDGGANFFGGGDIATGLDPVNEDVVLQLDVIGRTASMWVWRAGEPMPSTPLATTNGGRVPDSVSVALEALAGEVASAEFRYVAVNIPEPSSVCVAFIGFLSMTVGRRWGR